MKHWWMVLILLAGLETKSSAQATAARFHWQAGQVVTYKVEQATSVTDVVEGKTAALHSQLSTTTRWKVLSVDDAGIGTLQKSMTFLRLVNKTPSGETLVFDSAHPADSNPQMREQLSKYVGQPIAVLRVNSLGQVVEVKECKFGAASRFESDPPFVLLLPQEKLAAGLTWERAYRITLEPPQGTGEKFDATQKYVCKNLEGRMATIGVTTAVKSLPPAVADRIPLLEAQPEGEILFDLKDGALRKASLHIDKELKGHQGEGSSYRFQTDYTVVRAED